MNLFTKIFQKEPGQWGLRGDPYMWRTLMEIFLEMDDTISSAEFDALLDQKFFELINQEGRKTTSESVHFAKFPQQGMSGGTISLKWWNEIGLDLLKSRYKEEIRRR